ncbi:MAG: DUF2971 domain-containing protein [Planctomycetaceae bacterium]
MTSAKIPKSVFRYRSTAEHELAAIKNSYIWFSSPLEFNDPYDCRINGTIRDLEPKEYKTYFNTLANKLRLKRGHNNPAVDREISAYLDPQTGLPNERLIQIYKDELTKHLNDFRDRIGKNGGVCCFSARPDHPLMWSHYANGHRGICIEYSTEQNPFLKIRQVHYSERLPSIDPLTAMKLGHRVDDIMAALATKHKSWAYEEEWRLFHVQKSKKYFYPESLLKSVTLGSECSTTDINRFASAAKQLKIPLFKMKRSTVDYSMIQELI